MTTATGITFFILAMVSIAEALALAELWGRITMLEKITFRAKGNKLK